MWPSSLLSTYTTSKIYEKRIPPVSHPCKFPAEQWGHYERKQQPANGLMWQSNGFKPQILVIIWHFWSPTFIILPEDLQLDLSDGPSSTHFLFNLLQVYCFHLQRPGIDDSPCLLYLLWSLIRWFMSRGDWVAATQMVCSVTSFLW